jgi:hypothetical protein
MIGIIGASGQPWLVYVGLLGGLEVVAIVLAIVAFVLAIIGTTIAVRRPTRKGEAVIALIASALLMAATLAPGITLLPTLPS